MDKIVISIIIFVITLILFILGLSQFSIEGAKDLRGNPDKTLYANLGEVCSTTTFHAVCKEGLVCATKSGKIDFDRSIESGFCQDPNNITKTYREFN